MKKDFLLSIEKWSSLIDKQIDLFIQIKHTEREIAIAFREMKKAGFTYFKYEKTKIN